MPETSSPLPVYSGFWRRFAAIAVDAVLLGALMAAVSQALGQPGLLLRDDFVPRMGAFLASLAYFAGFDSSGWQGTPGKRAVRIKVTDLSGHRLGLGRAIWRRIAELFSFVSFGVGFLFAAFTRKRQSLHDLMAGTLVVRVARAPQEIAFSPPARAWPRWRIVLLLAGYLGGVFLLPGLMPQLQLPFEVPGADEERYRSRTEVVAALYYTLDASGTVESWFAEHHDFRGLDVDDLDIDEEATHLIDKVSVIDGTILITFGGASERALRGHSVALTPAVDEEGNIVWVCGYAEVPEGYVISRKDYRRSTNVVPDALPATCLPEGADDDAQRVRGPSVQI